MQLNIFYISVALHICSMRFLYNIHCWDYIHYVILLLFCMSEHFCDVFTYLHRVVIVVYAEDIHAR